MNTEVATSNEPEASIRAGIQKRAKNLATEELLIEVMTEKVWKLFGECELNKLVTYILKIESIQQFLMFGWGRAFLLSPCK